MSVGWYRCSVCGDDHATPMLGFACPTPPPQAEGGPQSQESATVRDLQALLDQERTAHTHTRMLLQAALVALSEDPEPPDPKGPPNPR